MQWRIQDDFEEVRFDQTIVLTVLTVVEKTVLSKQCRPRSVAAVSDQSLHCSPFM